MTTSPELGVTVLRGAAADVPTARMDGELRASTFPRGIDPRLDGAFAELAAQVRAAAQAEGYAAGWAAGHEVARREVRAHAAQAERERAEDAAAARTTTRTALQALSAAATTLESRAVVPATELRDAVLHGAVELAEALLGRELALTREPGLDAVRRALDLLPAGRPVTARLHPDSAAAVVAALAQLGPDELGREVRVVPDASVERAGAVVECDATRVDAQLSTALARVREVLAR